MEPFIQLFRAIDKDRSGEITKEELLQYTKDNDLEDDMVTTWLNLFDPENIGMITLRNFCDRLGLEERAVYGGLNGKIEVITHNMSSEDQIQLSNETIKLVDEHSDIGELTMNLKSYTDKTFGKEWQVAIVDGSYWIRFEHNPNKMFHFSLDNKAYLFWKI